MQAKDISKKAFWKTSGNVFIQNWGILFIGRRLNTVMACPRRWTQRVWCRYILLLHRTKCYWMWTVKSSPAFRFQFLRQNQNLLTKLIELWRILYILVVYLRVDFAYSKKHQFSTIHTHEDAFILYVAYNLHHWWAIFWSRPFPFFLFFHVRK
jgi:hypothetical protein